MTLCFLIGATKRVPPASSERKCTVNTMISESLMEEFRGGKI